MASFGPVQRPSVAASMAEKDSSKGSTDLQGDHGYTYTFNFICPLSIPSTPEAAAIRIVSNLVSFGLYYLHFVYVVLFIALIPQRKVSLVYLVGMREIGFLFLVFLRALPLPKLFLPYKSICKCLVLFLLCIGAAVPLILTKAGTHLLITLVSTLPAILVHATLWKEDFRLGAREVYRAADGEMAVPILLADDAADELSNSA